MSSTANRTRGDDYEYHLAQYMFLAGCKAQGISPFVQFLHHAHYIRDGGHLVSRNLKYLPNEVTRNLMRIGPCIILIFE